MPVQASSYTLNPPQADGRRYVHETHTLSFGPPEVVLYSAPPGTDYAAVMSARVAALNVMLAEREASDIVAGTWRAPTEQTTATLLARYWLRVQAAMGGDTPLDLARLLWWLESRLQAGHITDTEAYTALNAALGRSLSAGQWNTLRTSRIQPAFTRYAALLAEGPL